MKGEVRVKQWLAFKMEKGPTGVRKGNKESSRISRRNSSANTFIVSLLRLILTFGPPELQNNKFMVF